MSDSKEKFIREVSILVPYPSLIPLLAAILSLKDRLNQAMGVRDSKKINPLSVLAYVFYQRIDVHIKKQGIAFEEDACIFEWALKKYGEHVGLHTTQVKEITQKEVNDLFKVVHEILTTNRNLKKSEIQDFIRCKTTLFTLDRKIIAPIVIAAVLAKEDELRRTLLELAESFMNLSRIYKFLVLIEEKEVAAIIANKKTKDLIDISRMILRFEKLMEELLSDSEASDYFLSFVS